MGKKYISRILKFVTQRAAVAALAVVTTLVLSNGLAADFIKPWNNLTTNPTDGEPSWIGTGVTVYTVNAGTFRVGFDEAKKKNNYGAAGMNALVFSYGGSSSGRLVGGLSDSFTVLNNGNNNTFSDLIMVIAIDAESLPGKFFFSLAGPEWTAPGDPSGTNSNARDLSDDFVGYNPIGYATGRPSGYYATFTDETVTVPGSNPDADRFGYDFDNGMVTVFALRGLSLGPHGGTVTVNYEFRNLPGKAVFSVYGKLSDLERIRHTNRSLPDIASGEVVSTFEVVAVPEPASMMLLACGAIMLMRGKKTWLIRSR